MNESGRAGTMVLVFIVAIAALVMVSAIAVFVVIRCLIVVAFGLMAMMIILSSRSSTGTRLR